MASMKERLIARSIVDENTGCRNWEGARITGYGIIRSGGRNHYVHRVAYEHFVASIPAGLFVLHRCDNRRCLEPTHLFIGTTQDNVADRCAKHRSAAGEGHGRAKLKADHVMEIRTSNESSAALAKRFGVTPFHIRVIRRGAQWRTLPAGT